MSTRKIDIIAGVETAAFPTATDPSGDSDVMTKGYSDKTYTHGVADIAALKAIVAASRTDALSIFVKSLNAFFYFSSASAASGDDITVVTPTAGSGRWLRASGTGSPSHVQTYDASGIPSSSAQLAVSQGGTGQATASAAFNALSPNTTLGDLTYGSGTNTSTRLAGNTLTTKKFLSQTGNGTISAAPAWSQPAFTDITGTVAAAQLPNPTSSTLGGVQSAAAVANQWINSISTSGVPSLSQPAFSNLSGSVAATQMPALTGDVTTSAGAVATTIATNVVTNAKLAQMATNTIKGNNTGGTANALDLTVAQVTALLGVTASTATTLAERDANANLSANNFLEGFQTIATAAGTTTLTVSSPYVTQFTGVTTQTLTLPVVSTLTLGQAFMITNRSTGTVTVNSSGGNLVQSMAPTSQLIVTCSIVTGTTAASWDAAYSTAAAALTNPMTTGGDMIYGGASGTATRLANGTAGQVLASAGGTSAPAWSSSVGPTTGLSITGTNTNDNAGAGIHGEFSSANPGGNVTPAASGSWITITSVSLTAGDWDVEGNATMLTGTLGTGTACDVAISLTTNAQDDATKGGLNQLRQTVSTGVTMVVPTGSRRISIASTTTVYLVGRLNYSSLGTAAWTTGSFLRARRVR